MFDETSFQIPQPPIKGFRLFKTANPWMMNACLNFSYDMGYGYSEGYRRAAERLIEHVEATASEQDILVYPIVFLYRQHLELVLKEILKLLLDLGELQLKSRKEYQHHNLFELWTKCSPILKRLSPNENKEWFDAVTECLKQITEVDPNSDAFRFPRLKNGSVSVSGIKHINLSHLKEVMTSITDWLSGVSSFLSDARDNISNAL